MRVISGRVQTALFSAVIFIMPVAIALIGTFVLWRSVTNILDSFASLGWPTTDGVVVKATVTQESSRTSSQQATSTIMYGADVVYEYTVDGRQFAAGRVSFGDFRSSREQHAHEVGRRYPQGTKVTVHYSPSDPANAVLEPGFRPLHVLFVVVGVVFGGGLAFLGWGWIYLVVRGFGEAHATNTASPAVVPSHAAPRDLAIALLTDGRARTCFEDLPKVRQREFAEWIESAPRSDVRADRVRRSLALLREGKTLN